MQYTIGTLKGLSACNLLKDDRMGGGLRATWVRNLDRAKRRVGCNGDFRKRYILLEARS